MPDFPLDPRVQNGPSLGIPSLRRCYPGLVRVEWSGQPRSIRPVRRFR
jgi:hypothetical protein